MLKNKSKPLALILIILFFAMGVRAQTVNFNYSDGTNASYSLVDVRKITFDADLMNLHLMDGSTYSWNVSTIGYYEYDETVVNVEYLISYVNSMQAIVFPNPSNNMLKVQFNLPNEDAISIALFDMQGKIILEKKTGKLSNGQYEETIDISQVTAGAYVCRIVGQKNSISKRVIKQ
jgi:hypothetical protein